MSDEQKLLELIRDADVDGVVAWLAGASEKERREAFDVASDALHETKYRGRASVAASVALLGCGTVRDVRSVPVRIYVPPTAADVIAARPARTRDAILRSGVESERSYWIWPAIHELVKRGEIPKPQHEGYLVGLLMSATSSESDDLINRDDQAAPTADQVADRLRREPELIPLVFEAFRIDHGPAVWASGTWLEAIALLVATGDLERERALDEALAWQLAGMRPSSTKRFRDLWAALSPSVDELRVRRSGLVELLRVSDRGAQKLGLSELTRLATAVPLEEPRDVIDACRVPLSGTQKNLADASLRLLALVGKNDPEAAARAAMVGLGHPRQDIQEAALEFVVERMDLVDDPEVLRAGLLGWVDAATPQVQARIAEMTGVRAPARRTGARPIETLVEAARRIDASIARDLGLEGAIASVEAGAMPPPVRFPPWNHGALASGHRIDPIAEPVELVDVLAVVMTGRADGVDLERALDALSRFAAKAPPAHLASRLVTQVEEISGQLGHQAHRNPLLAAVVAWVDGRSPEPLPYLERKRPSFLRLEADELAGELVLPASGSSSGAFDGAADPANFEGMGMVRAWEVAYRCSRRTAQPLLAFPTHASGWLTSDVLLERLSWYAERNITPDRFDACQALLRLAPVGSDDVIRGLERLGTPVARAAVTMLNGSGQIRDEGLRRAAATSIDTGLPTAELVDEGESGSDPASRVRFPDAVVPVVLRRDDPVGLALAALRTPPRSATWWMANSSIVSGANRSSMLWTITMAPRFPDLYGAAVAASVGRELESHASEISDEALMALLPDDVPFGDGAHGGLAVSLTARSDTLGMMAIDLLSQVATDGRLDPGLLGSLLADLTTAGAELARPVSRIGAAGELSLLTAEQARRIFESLAASLPAAPGAIQTMLETWLNLASRIGRGVTNPLAREFLEEITATSRSPKPVKLAVSLLELPVEWDDATPERLALEEQIARAARWSS